MRDHRRAVIRIARSGYGIERAAGSVHWYLVSEGPQSVFISASGALYALRQATPEAEAWLTRHADCWVGNYTLRGATAAGASEMRHVITGDIRARLLELRRAVA